MPLADPHSVYLENLARRRAEAELLAQSGRQAISGAIGALGEHEAMRLRRVQDERAAAQDERAAADQTAQGVEREQRMKISLAAEARAAEKAAQEAAAEKAEAPLRLKRAQTEVDELASRTAADQRERAQRIAVETYRMIDEGEGDPDELASAAMAHAITQSGLSESEVNAAMEEWMKAERERNRATALDEEKARADIAAKEASAVRALRVPTAKVKPEPARVPDGAPDTRTRSRTRSIGAAEKILDEIEITAKKFEEATSTSATGRVIGRARQSLTGYIPGLNESERTAFLGNAEALNAMLFPILGREDAPTETEVKRLEPLMFSGKETPDELKSKIATIRRLLEIQQGMLPAKAAPVPVAVPAAPAAAPPSSGITRRGDNPDADAFLSGDF